MTGRFLCPIHGIPDCSALLNGCTLPARLAKVRQDTLNEAIEVAGHMGGPYGKSDLIKHLRELRDEAGPDDAVTVSRATLLRALGKARSLYVDAATTQGNDAGPETECWAEFEALAAYVDGHD